MKLFEVTITDEKITIRRESEEHLKAEQKYYLLMALLGVAVVLGFFWMMTGH